MKSVSNKDVTIYRKSHDEQVFIESPSSGFTHTEKWVVKTYKKFLQLDNKPKEFNSEKRAKKYAEGYMKKHDRY